MSAGRPTTIQRPAGRPVGRPAEWPCQADTRPGEAELQLPATTAFGTPETSQLGQQLWEGKPERRDQKLLQTILPGHDAIIHLACISNDPSFELNPNLGKSINFDAFEPLVKICRDKKINKFIFASSSSVYGVKKEKNVPTKLQ